MNLGVFGPINQWDCLTLPEGQRPSWCPVLIPPKPPPFDRPPFPGIGTDRCPPADADMTISAAQQLYCSAQGLCAKSIYYARNAATGLCEKRVFCHYCMGYPPQDDGPGTGGYP